MTRPWGIFRSLSAARRQSVISTRRMRYGRARRSRCWTTHEARVVELWIRYLGAVRTVPKPWLVGPVRTETYTTAFGHLTFGFFPFTNAEFTRNVFVISREKSSRVDEQHARLHRRACQRHEAVYRLHSIGVFLFFFYFFTFRSPPRFAFRSFFRHVPFVSGRVPWP